METKQLLKEASDLIKDLTDTIKDLKKENNNLSTENETLKEASEREKVARILEERSLVSYEKIASLRDGRIKKEEFERLKHLTEFETIDSNYEKNSSFDMSTSSFSNHSLDSVEKRREERAEQFYNGLQNIINK